MNRVKSVTIAAIVVVLCALPVSAANMLYNGGLEDFDYGPGDQTTTGIDVTWPVTVDAADADWSAMIGTWTRRAAGDWEGAPLGTGNDSTKAWAMRKGYHHYQILPKAAIASGDEIQVDWQYYVPADFANTVTYVVDVFGVNEAGDGEAATTVAGTLTFGGEAANSAVLLTSTVTVDALAGDGIWHSAPTETLTVADSWDYIGFVFRRSAGLTNNTSQQMDNFSLQIVPEPATLSLLALGGLGLLRRRR